MRRDVLRVGLGRLAFELALGVTLVLAADDGDRAIALGLAIAGALTVFATRTRWTSARRGFVAAHLAFGAVALAAVVGRWAPWMQIPMLALALGGAVELTHLDLMARRRIHETLVTVRWPQSILLRRLGSVIVASAGARAMVAVEANAHLASRLGVVSLLVAVGACAALSGGFGVGPGRPRARPIDAILFVGFAVVAAVFPIR